MEENNNFNEENNNQEQQNNSQPDNLSAGCSYATHQFYHE